MPRHPAAARTRHAELLALVKTAAGPGLELRDVPEPPMGINDVRIRVRKTGICGTDLHIADWDAWAERTIRPPLVVGHEFVGEVLEIGSNVNDLALGDIVSGEGHVVCGRCRHCRAGRWNLCANSIGLGVGRDGAFAEQVVLPVTNVWHHWPRIDEEVAAIFDPFGNAVHTALAFPVLGEDVLVVGAGPIGLMATAVVRHAGARYVVVSEPNAVPARAGEEDGRDARRRSSRAAASRTSRRSSAWSRASTSSSRCPATPAALRDAMANMAHGGGMAILGIPTEEVPIDFNQRHLQDADAPGHLRPGDVRDVVQDVGDAPVRARHPPGDHPSLLVPRARGGVRRGALRRLGQGDHGLAAGRLR